MMILFDLLKIKIEIKKINKNVLHCGFRFGLDAQFTAFAACFSFFPAQTKEGK